MVGRLGDGCRKDAGDEMRGARGKPVRGDCWVNNGMTGQLRLRTR